MRLLTPATSHTYLAGSGRLWSNLKAGVVQRRRMIEQLLASSSDENALAEFLVDYSSLVDPEVGFENSLAPVCYR